MGLSKNHSLSAVSPLLSLDEKLFFSYFAEKLNELVSGDAVEVFLKRSDESIDLVAIHGSDGHRGISREPRAIQHVARMKRHYVCHSVQRDPLYEIFHGGFVRGAAAIPLTIDGDVFAIVQILSYSEDVKISDTDILYVREFAIDHHISLQNLKMYLTARYLNEQLLKKLSEKDGAISEGEQTSYKVHDQKILGRSEKLIEAINKAKQFAASEIPLMIEGGAGVGKRTLARKIHLWSERNEKNMVMVECGAGDAKIVTTDLFGDDITVGALSRANGGTVILNDVHLLPKTVQARLLDFMVTGSYRDLGNKKHDVSVRLVALTKYSLVKDLQSGAFRDDLYYRLTTGHITLPNLADRGDDIAILAEHYLNEGKKEKKHLTQDAIESLRNHTWPGNIIELMNVLERAYTMTSGKFIEQIDIPDRENNPALESKEKKNSNLFNPQTLFNLEKEHIFRTLDVLEGNKTKTAKVLGITVKTLYNKLHSYGADLQK